MNSYDLDTHETQNFLGQSGNFATSLTYKGRQVISGLIPGQSITVSEVSPGAWLISSTDITGSGEGTLLRVGEGYYLDSGSIYGVSGIDVYQSGSDGIIIANGVKLSIENARKYAPNFFGLSGIGFYVNGDNIYIGYDSGVLSGRYVPYEKLYETGSYLVGLIESSNVGVRGLNDNSGLLYITGKGDVKYSFSNGNTFEFSGKKPNISTTNQHISGLYSYATDASVSGHHLTMGFTPNWTSTSIYDTENLTSYIGSTLSITGKDDSPTHPAWHAHNSNDADYYAGDALILKLDVPVEASAAYIYYGINSVWCGRWIYGSNDDTVWPSGWTNPEKWDLLFNEQLGYRWIAEETNTFTSIGTYKYYMMSGTNPYQAPSNISVGNVRLLSSIKTGLVEFSDIGAENVGTGVGSYVGKNNGQLKLRSITGENGIYVNESYDGFSIIIGSEINTGDYVTKSDTGILVSTGQLISMSGAIYDQIQNHTYGVSTIGGLSGVVTLQSGGNLSIQTGDNYILISGDMTELYNISGELTGTSGSLRDVATSLSGIITGASGALSDRLMSTGSTLYNLITGHQNLRSYGWYNNTGAVQATGFGPIFYIDVTQRLSGFRANAKTAPKYDVQMDVQWSSNYTSWASIFSVCPVIASGNYLNTSAGSTIGTFLDNYISGDRWIRFNFISGNGDGSGITAQLFSWY
jgi:hypothetical protein